MDAPRRDEYFRTGAAELLDAEPEVALTSVFYDGTDSNLLVNGMSAMAEHVSSQLAQTAANLIIETASGAPLVKLGYSQHQILPKPASPPFVDLVFARLAGAAVVTAFTIPSGTKVKSADGKQYETVTNLDIAAGTTTAQSVRSRSTLAGSSQAVAPNKLTSITSDIPGAPTDLVVTNPLASSGGADAEREDDYKTRCKMEPRSRARGTKDALEFGALSYPGVDRATAFEGIDVNGRANRIAGIVIADRFTDALVRQGAVSPTYEAQSQAFAKVVEQALNEYRAFGMHVSVLVAQVNLVSFLLRLRFRANADTERAKLAAAATVVAVINALPPGASVVPADIIAALRSVNGLDVRGDEVENPAGTIVTTSPYQVFRTTLSLIQFSTAAVANPVFAVLAGGPLASSV